MTPSESSHRDLSIEHNFTFGDNGPPCRQHSPHARTALPAADFAAAVAATQADVDALGTGRAQNCGGVGSN
eukprot:3127166-Prymnesium_polylepis.1